MIKTCGTTTLLRCIDKILDLAANIPDCSVEFVQYSRKNFLYPDAQQAPHNGFDQEVKYLNELFDGKDYVLGPLSGDHWYLYIADYTTSPKLSAPEQTIEIMMHELDREAMNYYHQSNGLDAKQTTEVTHISDIIPGSTIDEFLFEPCGYSMNSLLDEAYQTIHITPEPHCSYVSYETNSVFKDYSSTINNVLNIFKPGKFTLTYCVSGGSDATKAIQKAFSTKLDGFTLKNKCIHEFEGNHHVIMCNYESSDKIVTCPMKRIESIGRANHLLTEANIL